MRVLFVDRDSAFLASVRELLAPLESEFDCLYCDSTESAIAHLERYPFDVILADQRLEGTTGGELLTKVQENWPKITRLLLVSQSELESMASTYGIAQQFVLKPCDGGRLIETLRGILDLRAKTHSPFVMNIVGKFRTLPTMDPVYLALMKLLTAGASSDQIAVVLARDSAFSARLLQLANSPYIASVRRVASIADAVSLLGHNLTRSLLITHQASKLCTSAHGKYMTMIGEQTEKIANVMKIITPREYRSDEAITTGILSNVGKFVLLATEAESYMKVLDEAQGNPSETHQLEMVRFNTTHAEIGGFLLGIWGLPSSIITAVTNHHTKGEIVQSPTLYALDLADRVQFSSRGEVLVPDPIDYDDPFGMDAKLNEWKTNFTLERSAI